MQLVPFPRMNPLQPSSFHIFIRPFPTDILYSFLPALWIWNNIFNRSSGETTVRDTAPAIPPARNAATTGCDTVWRNRKRIGIGDDLLSSLARSTGDGAFESRLMASEERKQVQSHRVWRRSRRNPRRQRLSSRLVLQRIFLCACFASTII